jgi:hypothetical protein
MAIILERINSQEASVSGRNVRLELIYRVSGYTTALQVYVAVLNGVAESYPWSDGDYTGFLLKRESISIEPVHVDEDDQDACIWTATVGYARPEHIELTPDTGDSEESFDIRLDTTHITQSLGTVNSYAAPGTTAPDHDGAINVTSEGVEGVDILTPTWTFSETHYIALADLTDAYKATLAGLVGTKNNDTFRGHAAGEVFLLGASGHRRGSAEDAAVSFVFGVSKNATGLSVGTITGISKLGWDYLWVKYKPVVDANSPVRQPVAAYVEKVYKDGDFSQLLPSE